MKRKIIYLAIIVLSLALAGESKAKTRHLIVEYTGPGGNAEALGGDLIIGSATKFWAYLDKENPLTKSLTAINSHTQEGFYIYNEEDEALPPIIIKKGEGAEPIYCAEKNTIPIMKDGKYINKITITIKNWETPRERTSCPVTAYYGD
jgi:hypothetical protein